MKPDDDDAGEAIRCERVLVVAQMNSRGSPHISACVFWISTQFMRGRMRRSRRCLEPRVVLLSTDGIGSECPS